MYAGEGWASGNGQRRDEVVVVVDDEDAARYARSSVLRRAGYTVHEADSGAAALHTVASTKPDLVVLDVRLPDISGIEVCRTIKRKRPSTLVLQTSAVFVERSDRVRGLATDADAYIVEPIDSDELLANVSALFRLRRDQAMAAGEPGTHDGSSRAERLLMETYHQTKNDFQLAVSLLSLQSVRSSDPSLKNALREAMERLRAMAHVHELLYSSGTGTSVDGAELIRAVCRGLPNRVGSAQAMVRLSFELEPFVCGRDRAVLLALITNEVVTNALKHVFPRGAGSIHLKLAREDGATVLTVTDDGFGVEQGGPDKEDFSKELVLALARQLNDPNCIYEHAQGTAFRLVVSA